MLLSKSISRIIFHSTKRVSDSLIAGKGRLALCSLKSVSSNANFLKLNFRMGSFISCHSDSVNISGSQEVLPSREYSNMSDTFEAEICQEDEIPDEGMKSFPVEGIENGKVLLVKTGGNISAIGTKCSHYGAPLEKGVICNGQVKCPFHGACFNVKSGDIEEFPGLDSIPSYHVQVKKGKVTIKGQKKDVEQNKRVQTMASLDPKNKDVYALIGGGVASIKCAETLRQRGFTGKIAIYSKESALPYDRPKISKAMHLKADQLVLRSKTFLDEANIEFNQGKEVASIDAVSKTITFSNGSQDHCTKMFIATGGSARKLDIPGIDLPNVYVLRTPEDAEKIVNAAKNTNLVIVGTSFIGMEAAAYFATDERAASVTVIGSSSVPFQRSLGEPIGKAIMNWFEERGIKFINSTSVQEIISENQDVKQVILSNGDSVNADLVVLGVGVTPATKFLSGSGIELDANGFVPVNENMETNVPGIFCGGDIASFPLFTENNQMVSIGHWQIAHNHGHIAALNMAGIKTAVRTVPFFWTVLFGKSLRYAGNGNFDDIIINGNLDELSFIAYYCKGDKVIAMSSLMRDPAVARFAGYIQSGKTLTKEQVIQDNDIASKL